MKLLITYISERGTLINELVSLSIKTFNAIIEIKKIRKSKPLAEWLDSDGSSTVVRSIGAKYYFEKFDEISRLSYMTMDHDVDNLLYAHAYWITDKKFEMVEDILK